MSKKADDCDSITSKFVYLFLEGGGGLVHKLFMNGTYLHKIKCYISAMRIAFFSVRGKITIPI